MPDNMYIYMYHIYIYIYNTIYCILLCCSDLEGEKTVVGVSLRVDHRLLTAALEAAEAATKWTSCVLTGRLLRLQRPYGASSPSP
jgi:hypothetical protein